MRGDETLCMTALMTLKNELYVSATIASIGIVRVLLVVEISRHREQRLIVLRN
jgi:hypothetical protein